MKPYKSEKFKSKQAWLEGHSRFLGGSSAGIIFGVSKYKNKLELYNEIVNKSYGKNSENTENIKLGVSSEPLIRKLFALNFPNYEVKSPKGYQCFINRKHPYLGATLDGILIDKSTNEKGILEIKTFDVRKKGDMDEWNGRIPKQYYCQIIHYLMVMTDFKFVKVVAQLRLFDWDRDSNDNVKELRTVIKHIERSEVEEDIETLRKAEIDFWENNVLKRIPPSFTRKVGE